MKVRLRPIAHDDRDALLAFYRSLSAESLHSRFFETCSPETALAGSPVDVDARNIVGIVAELNDQIVGVAHYFRLRDSAEVAFAVRDDLQGCGIATRLLETLAASARTNHIKDFVAEVLPDNRAMMDVFRGFSPQVSNITAGGVLHVSFPVPN